MFYCGDSDDPVSILMEANTKVADAEPEFGRVDILKTFYISVASSQITSKNMQDVKCRVTVYGPKLRLRLR